MGRATLEAAYPMFPCADVAASASFYESQLGFTTVFRHGDEYARLQRDAVTLDLWKCVDPAMTGNEPGCRVLVDDIDAIHREFSANIPQSDVDGARPLVTSVELRPWGLKEFAVLDPDNNVLHVGERPR